MCKDKNAVYFFTTGNDKKKYVAKEKLYKEARKYLSKDKVFKKEIIDALHTCINEYKDRAILIVGSFYVYKTIVEELNNDKIRKCRF